MNKIMLMLALLIGLNAEARVAGNAYVMPSSGNIAGWGPINLAGGSTAVTGLLPSANISSLASLYCSVSGCTLGGNIAMGGFGITGLVDPTNPQDAATKNYVDNVGVNGVAKAASIYASTTALPAIVYNNGASGVGATLTGVTASALSIDGSAPTFGQRVLVKNQVSTFQNGIYTVTATGSGIAVFVLTRATDFNSTTDIVDGATTYITSGSTLSNQTWQLAVAGTVTVGTTGLVFNQIAGPGTIAAGTGITVTGSTVAISNTAVTPGSYTNLNATVNAQGQITAASNGSSGGVTSVALTAPSAFTVSGSPVTSSGTLALSYSGTAIPVSSGGTGANTFTAGIIKASGTSAFTTESTVQTTEGGTGLNSYTTGDTIYATGTNTIGRLAACSSGQIVTYVAGIPTCTNNPASLAVGSMWTGISSTFTGSVTSGGFTDPTIVTGTITQTYSSNITCVKNATKLGIDCTFPNPGNYTVCYSGYGTDSAVAAGVNTQLVDGSNTVISGYSNANNGSANTGVNFAACVGYIATGTTATFKIQAATSAGGFQVYPTSFQVSGTSVSSILPDSVAFGGASEPSNCTASPCTVYRSSSRVSSVTRTSTGIYVVNFSPAYTVKPTCTITSNQASGDQWTQSAVTTSALTLNSRSSGTLGDDSANVICFGN